MFKKVITSTPFSTPVAREVFPNIDTWEYMNDISLCATLRALLGPRMGDDTLQIVMLSRPGDVRGIAEDTWYTNTFLIANYVDARFSDNAAMKAEIAEVEHRFERGGWTKVEKVTVFFKKQFYASCFVNPDRKNTIVIIENLDIAKFHYLQCGIPAFFPWYITKDGGISPLELELLKSLKEKTADKYEEVLKKMADEYDFRMYKIEKYLKGFETLIETRELRKMDQKIAEVVRAINEYNEQISNLLRSKRTYEAQCYGLKMKIEEHDGRNELMDYFKQNKNLILECCDDNCITFGVTGVLSNFDPDEARAMIEKSNSLIYGGTRYSKEDMKRLFTAIFIDETIKVHFCAAYRMYLSGGVEAITHWNYSPDYDGNTPNPHIDQYRCMGAYQDVIDRIMKDGGDYILAIEQCIASCCSLNFGDYTVMNEFIARINGAREGINLKCMELPDGSIVTPREAMRYLRGENDSGEDN